MRLRPIGGLRFSSAFAFLPFAAAQYGDDCGFGTLFSGDKDCPKLPVTIDANVVSLAIFGRALFLNLQGCVLFSDNNMQRLLHRSARAQCGSETDAQHVVL